MLSSPTLNLCIVDGDEVTGGTRRYPRVAVNWPAEVDLGAGPQPATLLDVSTMGAFVQPEPSSQPPQRGQAVALRFFPSSEQQPIVARGTVRWCGRSNTHDQRGFGVEFETDLAQVAKLIGVD